MYVPHGQYLVTANNFLGATNFFALNGIAGRIHFSMVGDGWNSQIYFKPSGGVANYYMYQNTPGQNNLIDWVFSNLYFRLDSSNVAAGSTLSCFLENGSPGYATQGIKCDRVKIVGADYPSTAAQIAAAGTVFTCNGTVNADVTNMIGCRVRGMKTLLDIGTNAQSVCHTFVATDAEVMYGDVFKIGGGSSVNVFGGSYTMFTSASTLSYLVAVRETTVALAGTLNFYGMRCEFNYPDPGTPTTAYSCAFFLDGVGSAGDSWNSTFVKVNFEGCNFYPTDGASRNMINVDAASKSVINFRGCDLGNTSLWKVNVFSSKATLQVASNGPFTAVNFREGYAPLFSNVTYTDTNSVARISVRDCPNTIDYDLSANGISETKIGRARTLKTATIWGGAWTDVGVSVMSLQLPPNCLIKSVRFRKVAGGASVTTYQLQATDSNSVVNYCSSTIAAQNVNHEAFGDNLNIVANTAAKQLIYIINPAGQAGSSVSTPMAAGDYVMVDYY